MQLPAHCHQCSWIVDKMGACGPPGSPAIYVIASFIPYVIIIIFIALSLFSRSEKQFKMALLLLSAYIIGDRIFKNLLQSPRPEGACKKSYGFPSSHMVVLVCYAFSLWNNCTKGQRIFLLSLIIMQGLARVGLKYHTWSQVIGGIVFGFVYTILFCKIWERATKSSYFSKICNFLGVSREKIKQL